MQKLTPHQVDLYLERIGVERPDKLDFAALAAIHRAHLMTFTWEALDAFMGWPSSVDPQTIFTKMVTRKRGGWCFEMNGLLGAALDGLGFRVTRLCGGVDREKLGDAAIGNHLTLRVDLDRPYLAEVGLADAIVEPVPMAIGPLSQRGFDFSIMPTHDSWLRFYNHPLGLARSFDFRADHQDETALAAAQAWLMRDSGSPFTGTLAILRHTREGYVSLQNNRFRTVTAVGDVEHLIETMDEFATTLSDVFALDVPRHGQVWVRVQAVLSHNKAA
ncbi:N-hydroxyarylamine O-acetyltransferase [Pararhizobium capsulatum DSM 1112]|uniref:N-hydroxyarylamine O-acetyltransferase n=1 Tax=Pararhizobium capsulatum DSM 1112 TaxID=1121113 RepID=A0ABU0BXQ1_9HYPH|nr:arylamine N-acetyltransferase [Pararhizobium capsulatum]MDQ0322712.1 N-hydroxyarylamine O-acetyltransferase [Pararhizobium capsulatum DSM 1112]